MFIQSKASTGSSNSLIIRHSDLNTISINYIHQCIDTGHLQGHYFSGDLPIFPMTGQLSAWMAIVVFCCTTVVIDEVRGSSAEDYKRLHRSLLANYSTSVRPVLDQDDTVFIATALYLAGINDVDTVAQRLVTTAFLDLAWFDEFLQWDELSTRIEIMYFKQVCSFRNFVHYHLLYCKRGGN